MKKYTIEEFAVQIRSKYPNSYDDLDDEELISLWLKKFPKDEERIIHKSVEDHFGTHSESNSSAWLLIIIAGAVFFFTNPSLEKHKTVSANDMMSILKESKTYDLMNTFSFGKGEDLLISSIKGGIHRSNYFLFSLTTIYISDDKDTEVIGIGILGMVFIFDDAKQELKSKIKSYDSAAGLFFGS